MELPSSRPTAAGRRAATTWLAPFAVGVIVLATVRLRGKIPMVVELHAWLAAQGIPDGIRNLDSWLILLLTALLVALVLARGRVRVAADWLGLTAPSGRALAVAGVATLPMVAAGLITGAAPRWPASLLVVAALAPLVEEVFFRGLLCALVVRAAGMPFWSAALASAAAFGASHVSWTTAPTGGTLAVVMVTMAGGVWFAWLLRSWRWNLWVAVFLHALMNLTWGVFAVEGGALGTPAANIGRASTIALATVITLRPSLLGLPPTATRTGAGSG